MRRPIVPMLSQISTYEDMRNVRFFSVLRRELKWLDVYLRVAPYRLSRLGTQGIYPRQDYTSDSLQAVVLKRPEHT